MSLKLAFCCVLLIPSALAAQAITDPFERPIDPVPKLVKYLQRIVREPASIRDMRVCEATPVSGSLQAKFSIKFSMNSRNGYGGYTGPTYFDATMTDGQVTYVAQPNLGPELNAKLLTLTENCLAVPDARVQELLIRP